MKKDHKEIQEIAKILLDVGKSYYGIECDQTAAMCEASALYNAGYRKQSADMVSIKTIKKWLYEMAINNVGCVLEGDFSNACEEIISRLDGLKRFAEELKGGVEE